MPNVKLVRSVLCGAALFCSVNHGIAHAQMQEPAPPPQAATAPPYGAAPTLEKPSALIAPAVDHLSEVVSQVQLERWKGNVRDETDSNLRSIERDLKETLPPLVTAADAQPASVASSLPLLRNLDALCAVLIRVSVTARANAPAPQADAIAGSLTALQNARNTLGTQVQDLATTQEKQIASLKTNLASLTAKVNSTPAPAPPPPPPAKPHRAKKVAKPANPATTAKPTAPPKPAQ